MSRSRRQPAGGTPGRTQPTCRRAVAALGLTLLLTSTGALGCGAAEKVKETVIMKAAIGKWICTEQVDEGDPGFYEITVRQDGTWRLIEEDPEYEEDANGGPIPPTVGTWSVENGNLSTTIDRKDEDGKAVTAPIYDISGFADLTEESDNISVDHNWDGEEVRWDVDVDVTDLTSFTLTARSAEYKGEVTELTEKDSNSWTCEKSRSI